MSLYLRLKVRCDDCDAGVYVRQVRRSYKCKLQECNGRPFSVTPQPRAMVTPSHAPHEETKMGAVKANMHDSLNFCS